MLALSWCLDWALKDELKKKFLHVVYGERESRPSLSEQLSASYDILSTLFGGRGFFVFVRRSLLMTTVMLIVLTLLQSMVNSEVFASTTVPFIRRLLSLQGGALLLIIGVGIIDLISIYQTITFLRISRGCKNLWEVSFLSAADILLSLILFIMLFPFFVTIGFLANAPTISSFDVILSAALTNQTTNANDILRSLLVFDPRKSSDVPNEAVDALAGRKWFFRNYQIAVYVGDEAKPSLKDALHNSRSAGSMVLQTRGNLSDVRVFEILETMLRARRYVREVSPLEAAANFYTTYALIRLNVLTGISFTHFWSTYADVLRMANFLDSELFRIIQLDAPEISANDIALRYNLNAMTLRWSDYSCEQYIYCDGAFSVHPRLRIYEVAKHYDKCKEAVAIDSLSFQNVRGLGLYSLAAEQQLLPISPLALSSLTATIIIYYLLLARLCFRSLRGAPARLLRNGDALLRKHLFLATTIAIYVIFLPVFILARLLIDKI